MKRILNLPAPTGIERVETGAIQFGNDWPGIFIRGDDAQHLMYLIHELSKAVVPERSSSVSDLLERLKYYAMLIEQDVIV